jgi:hypothetical protein
MVRPGKIDHKSSVSDIHCGSIAALSPDIRFT